MPDARTGHAGWSWAAGVAGGAVLVLLPGWMPNRYWLSVLVLIAFKTLMVSSLRLNHLMGFISLGHVGFLLVGAYTSALLAVKAGLWVWWAIALGSGASLLLALVIGYPFLRVQGAYFVVLTFLMAEALRLAALYSPQLTGGETGLARIPALPDLELGSWRIALSETRTYYYFLLLVTGAVLLGLRQFERSRFGGYCRAIAESEAICQAAGIDTRWVKIATFSGGALLAGFTGALWAHYEGVLTPSASSVFGIMNSIFLLVYLEVGGRDYLLGPLCGVVLLTLVQELTHLEAQYMPLVVGGTLMLAVFLLPRGVAALLDGFVPALRGPPSRLSG